MAYFLTDQQEYELNLFLDEQNRIAYNEQINSDEISDELKEIIKKTEESGSPIPAFDPKYGYYSISFTPCEEGNRIYVHHHITNQSKSIYDPANNVEIISDQNEKLNNTENFSVTEPEIIQEEFEVEESIDDQISSIISNKTYSVDEVSEKLTSIFGNPPENILAKIEQ
jgi:hypothetical protein